MIALLLAAQVAAAPAAPFEVPLSPNAKVFPMPVAGMPDARCKAVERRTSNQIAEQYRQLGRLPPAGREYAVLRRVDGCMVAAPMGYHPPLLPGKADRPR